MARKKSNRRGPLYQGYPGYRGSPSGIPPQSANAGNALAAGFSEFGTIEMNSHLPERFTALGHARRPQGHYPDPDHVPLAASSRTNNDILQYIHDAKKPVGSAGPWIDQPEIPTSAEIMSFPTGFTQDPSALDSKVRPNKVEGAYDTNEEYLGTQYELLREDALRPLRRAVEAVWKSPELDEFEYPPERGVGIYEPVYLKGVVFSPRGLAAKVAFSLSRVKKHIRWEQSKRLLTGTIVVLSPFEDGFRTPSECVVATVAARPLDGLALNPPEIDLFFAASEDFDFDPARKWMMVECRNSFYEASRHTLLALQHMMREPFPLSEHIVKGQTQVKTPRYVESYPYADMSSLVGSESPDRFKKVNILEEWPAGDNFVLDSSQSKALQRMLTKSLAIVQGPPGTGKTYVSVVALKTMLATMNKNDPPIIVACQTNHALDQLLRHVAEFEPSFVRLGGRSKDQGKVKERVLYEVRLGHPQQKGAGNRKNKAAGTLRQLTGKMQALMAPFEAGKPPLDHDFLFKKGLLSKKQADSIKAGAKSIIGIVQETPSISMEHWLGKCVEPRQRPFQPDFFGMDWGEEGFEEIEQLMEMEAEAVAKDDDDIEALRGPTSFLSDNWMGMRGGALRKETDVQRVLENTGDLSTVPLADRGAIYNYLLKKAKKIVLSEFRALAKEYERFAMQRKIGQWEQDQGILAEQRLIGMTTTGLSKYRALISSLRPKVVLIEEAAETLEAPVAVACLPTLEHLVLVGDHQQLRPHCNVRELEDEPYFFNMSLFERMVCNDIQLDTLTRQRRMIPEIRRLLEPIYGNTLKDHPIVKTVGNRPDVEGMGGVNSFFFTHTWPEGKDSNMSTTNKNESEMIVGLLGYLILNGAQPGKVTVLTFYNGQRKFLQQAIHRHPALQGKPFKIATVDSYQGEENDIVILSLVRSNQNSEIGFLSNANRVCVALSRAKRGFYLFGNAELLANESMIWGVVVKTMWGHGKAKEIPMAVPTRIGYHLPLTCTNHGQKTFVQTPGDWEFINGGCTQQCGCSLPCGHTCRIRCHPFEQDQINCTQKCNRTVESCGHPCGLACGELCKCLICNYHSDGKKPLVKPLSKLRPQTGPANPVNTRKGIEAWHAYAQGGVEEEDARDKQEIIERNKQYEKDRLKNFAKTDVAKLIDSAKDGGNLVKVPTDKGPTKPSGYGKVGLLVDISDDSSPEVKVSEQEDRISGGVESKVVPNFNLLD